MRILVVDGNRDNLEFLCRILEDRHEVVGATSGTQCLDLMRKTPPDLILLDVKISETGGCALIEKLRALETTRDVAVILLTDPYEGKDRVTHGLELKVLDHLIRPVAADVLLAKVSLVERLTGAEERTRRLQIELEATGERLTELDELKSTFLASISHELRTPLNSILGFSGILLQGLAGELNEEQAKQLGMIRGAGRRLLDLVNGVLDIAQIDSGCLEVAAEACDVTILIEEVVNTITPLAGEKELAVVVDVASNVERITSDRRRVKQILLSLLDNALEFTKEGEIRIESEMHGDELVVRVIDTGIGIPPDDMGGVFAVYRQLDKPLASHHEGGGLGLFICRKLARLLGGDVTGASGGAGLGCTFTLRLPRTRHAGRFDRSTSRPPGSP